MDFPINNILAHGFPNTSIFKKVKYSAENQDGKYVLTAYYFFNIPIFQIIDIPVITTH